MGLMSYIPYAYQEHFKALSEEKHDKTDIKDLEVRSVS
jgi:hypothetical protein